MADAFSCLAAATVPAKPLWPPAVGEEPEVAAGLWPGGKWRGKSPHSTAHCSPVCTAHYHKNHSPRYNHGPFTSGSHVEI